MKHDGESYPLEDIREFMARRWFLASDRRGALMSEQAYRKLLKREDPSWTQDHVAHLRSFIMGWLAARR
jgi:hypothetical protein